MLRSAYRRLILVFLVGQVLASSAACVTQKVETGRLEVRTLYSSAVCDSRREEGVVATWLDSPKAVATAYRRITGSRMNAGPPPTVNFKAHGALLIEMGRRSTGGYRLSLAERRLAVTGDRAQVQVAWNEPAAGAMVPQIITSPCLLLELPRGDFSAVQVVDQAGKVLAVAEVRGQEKEESRKLKEE